MTAAQSQGPRVVIVGGGIIGACCAYYLAKRGARPVLVERDEVARGASYGNAGAIVPGHTPINKPGRVVQALRSLFNPLSPLYIAPRLDLDLIKWLWRFARTCSMEHLRRAMDVLGPMGHLSRKLYLEFLEEERPDCAARTEGYYEVYRSEKGLVAAEREAAFISTYGYRFEKLTGEELRRHEPCFKSDVLAGIYAADAITADPYKLTLAFVNAARRLGAQIRQKAKANRVLTTNGSASGVQLSDGELVTGDMVIVAAGAYCKPLLRRFGLYLPLQPAKGYHIDRQYSAPGTPPLRVACLLGETLIFCTPMGEFVRFAGTLEFSGLNHEIRRPRLEQLTRGARLYLSGLEPGPARSEWCGLRPCLPDGLPAIGPVAGVPGLWVATGHAMQGMTLGPVTGYLLAEWILDGKPSLDIAPLSPERFR